MAVSNSHTWPLVSATQDTSANSRTPLQDSGTLQLIAGQTVNPPETLNVNSTVGRHNYSLCSFLSPCNFLIPVFYIFYTVLSCFLNRAVPDFASGSGQNLAVFLNPAKIRLRRIFRRSRIFGRIRKTVRNGIFISNNKPCSKSFITRSCQMQH